MYNNQNQSFFYYLPLSNFAENENFALRGLLWAKYCLSNPFFNEIVNCTVNSSSLKIEKNGKLECIIIVYVCVNINYAILFTRL